MREEFDHKIEDIIKAEQGDKDAMQYLIATNKGLIWSIIKRFQDRGYELEDLYQIGVMGFIKCVKRFFLIICWHNILHCVLCKLAFCCPIVPIQFIASVNFVARGVFQHFLANNLFKTQIAVSDVAVIER